jgi:cytosine/creatinine deaminase
MTHHKTVDLIKDAQLRGRDGLFDLRIDDGVIVAIEDNLETLLEDTVLNAHGRLLLPGFVDLHTHLDKTMCGLPNASGTLHEAIAVWLGAVHLHTYSSVYTRARAGLERAIAHGTTAMRSHVDVITPAHLESVRALLQLRQDFRASIDLQLSALGRPSEPESYALMAEAIRMGVDCVGGAPLIEQNPEASVLAAFKLAARYGCPVDLHVDETEDPQSSSLRQIAALTKANGMQGLVTAGHCVSLAFMDRAAALEIVALCTETGITIVTLPSCNLVLMGRGREPAPRGVTRVKDMLAAGVNICAGSDNVRDPFNPFGDYDLLHAANLCAHVAHLSGTDEINTSLDMVTRHPARAFYGREVGIDVGAPADLVLLEETNPAAIVPVMPPRAAVVKRGYGITESMPGQ